MKRILFLLVPSLVTFSAFAQEIVRFNDGRLTYNGRMRPDADHVRLEWPGTSVRFGFEGSGLSVDLKDDHGADRYNVIIDGRVTGILTPDSVRREYELAKGLSKGRHTIELFKRTEGGVGGTALYQFKLNKGAKLSKLPERERRIEFYGNSITCGMAIGDTLTTGVDENNYLAYGSVTARAFDADLSCIAKSGIGLMVSWFPEIMPEMYDRVYGTQPGSKWDFSRYVPQVVVVDLGQNDSWIVDQPQNAQFKARFGEQAPSAPVIVQAYITFFKKLREKYPDAHIICTLGSMDATKAGSPWPGYLETAVKDMNDPKCYSLIFPYDPPVNKKDQHPGIKEHQRMADRLISFIHSKVNW